MSIELNPKSSGFSDEIRESCSWSPTQIAEIESAIQSIREFRVSDFDNDTFGLLQLMWRLLIAQIPLPVVELNFSFLARIREITGELFTQESEISYPPACDWGRFSFPGSPMFYAAVPHDDEQRWIGAGVLECCKELVDDSSTKNEFEFCIGRWFLKRPIQVLNLCFHEEHLSRNPQLATTIAEFLQAIETVANPDAYQVIRRAWDTLTYYATKGNPSCADYFKSTSLLAAIRTHYHATRQFDIHGVLYPSVMTEYDGLNVVLSPGAVDSFLELREALAFRVKRNPDDRNDLHGEASSLVSIVKDHRFDIVRTREDRA